MGVLTRKGSYFRWIYKKLLIWFSGLICLKSYRDGGLALTSYKSYLPFTRTREPKTTQTLSQYIKILDRVAPCPLSFLPLQLKPWPSQLGITQIYMVLNVVPVSINAPYLWTICYSLSLPPYIHSEHF